MFLPRKQSLKWDSGYESITRNLALRTLLPVVGGEQLAHDCLNDAVVKIFIIGEPGWNHGWMEYVGYSSISALEKDEETDY